MISIRHRQIGEIVDEGLRTVPGVERRPAPLGLEMASFADYDRWLAASKASSAETWRRGREHGFVALNAQTRGPRV